MAQGGTHPLHPHPGSTIVINKAFLLTISQFFLDYQVMIDVKRKVMPEEFESKMALQVKKSFILEFYEYDSKGIQCILPSLSNIQIQLLNQLEIPRQCSYSTSLMKSQITLIPIRIRIWVVLL